MLEGAKLHAPTNPRQRAGLTVGGEVPKSARHVHQARVPMQA
jgi:hypothetical protein